MQTQNNALPYIQTLTSRPSLDVLLRLDEATDNAYEAEQGAARAVHLSRMILLGLLLYNCYNATSVFLMPDILWTSIFIRTVVFTVPTLGLAYLVLKVGPKWREVLVLNGMTGAFTVPVALFWWTEAPLGSYAFTELDLTLVFGGLVLGLRFRHNLVFMLFAFALMCLAVWTKPGLPEGLAWAFTLQSLTACIFVGVSNYLVEKRRCQQFIDVLAARQRAASAELETQVVHQLSLTDALTGLPNRRALDIELDRRFETKQDLAILMGDIDFFKLLNDTLGHAEGDNCLVVIARALAKTAKDHGVFVARFGGEEFAVIIPARGSFEVSRIAQEILRSVRAVGFSHPSRPDGLSVVTLSLGAAMRYVGDDMTVADLMKNADAALYAAKSKGRNRVITSEEIKRRIVGG